MTNCVVPPFFFIHQHSKQVRAKRCGFAHSVQELGKKIPCPSCGKLTAVPNRPGSSGTHPPYSVQKFVNLIKNVDLKLK